MEQIDEIGEIGKLDKIISLDFCFNQLNRCTQKETDEQRRS